MAGVGSRGKLSDSEYLEIIECYVDGASAASLAKRHQVNPSTIHRIVTGGIRPGLPISSDLRKAAERRCRDIKAGRGRNLADQYIPLPEDEMCRRYLSGEPATSIASSLGVCSPTVYNRLRRNGVRIRGAADSVRAAHQLGLPTETGPVHIYGLIDPRTGMIRYVGKSTNPHARLNSHLGAARGSAPHHVSRWIRGLIDLSLQPELEVLETVDPSAWQEAESRWITRLIADGCALTNETPGGFSGLSGEANHNARLSDNEVLRLVASFVAGEEISILCARYRIGKSTFYRLIYGRVRSSAVPESLRECAIDRVKRPRGERPMNCCKYGHALDKENLYRDTQGHRQCRICSRARSRRSYAKKAPARR